MRQYAFAFCGLVLLVICGAHVVRAGVTYAERAPDLQSATLILPLPLAHGGAGRGAGHEGAGEGGGAARGDWQHFVSWVGHFHPALTVFPIAMILSAALAELLRLWTKAPWLDGASRWCMIVGGIGAAITAPLGWAFATEHGGSWTLEVHRWLGTAAGAGGVVLLVLSELARRRGGGTLTLFRSVLFLAVPLVMATGFFGGAMVYGLHEYDWSRPADPQAADAESAAESAGGEPAAPGTRPSAQGDVAEVAVTDDDTFKPDQVTIPAGGTVRWKNVSKDTHTVTDDPKVASNAKDVSFPAGAKPFNSGKIKPGAVFEQRFTVPGTYQYVYEPHEEMDMKGKVVVSESDKAVHAAAHPAE